MRIATVLAVALLGTSSLAIAQHAQAAIQHYQFDIPRQSLDAALKDLAQQTGLQIGRFSGKIDGSTMVGPVKGEQTPEQALKTLLYKTGLDYKIVSDTTIAVYNPKDPTPSATGFTGSGSSLQVEGSGDSLRLSQLSTQSSTLSPQSSSQLSPKSSVPSTTLAQSQVQSGPEVKQPQEGKIEEIIVTAQKRSERLQDVPIPVTVVVGGDLLASNELRLQDFATSVPGLSVISSGSEQFFQVVSIRGITTGTSGNPTVGFTVDDVSYGADTGLGWAGMLPDIDPGDLARVEVLKGPQGTLYGASSMGGLIKFVTIDPSTAGFSGRIQAGVNGVSNGAETGYNFRGSVNVPVSDKLAIRASVFTREDPGYIDNITTHTNGVGEERVSGGRLSGLWRPSDDVSLKVSALYQYQDSNGISIATPGLGELQQSFHPGATGQSSGTVQAYSATLAAKLGNVNLTSITGYNVRTDHIVLDESQNFGPSIQTLFGVNGAGLVDKNDTGKFTEEMRFSGEFGHRVDWLLGGVYTNELSRTSQQIPALNPSGATVGLGYDQDYPSTYIEYAAFGDLTFHITDRFDVQGGLRQSKIDQSIRSTTYDPVFTGGLTTITIAPPDRNSSHPLTYLATPRFKVSDDFMVYARFASGYRAGGTNSILCTQFNFSCAYGPDKTQDYEIGTKGDALDHKLTFDASAYYIDWSKIQLNALSPEEITFISNASHAKSQGVELTLQAKPWTGTIIGAEATYDDAVLIQSFASDITLYGPARSRLPYTSRYACNFSIDQRFPINSNVTGIAGADLAYVGDRLGNFQGSASSPRQNLPGYVRMDLHLGAKYNTWDLSVFVNNVFDKRGLVDGPGDTFPVGYIYIQPRTVGMNLAKNY